MTTRPNDQTTRRLRDRWPFLIALVIFALGAFSVGIAGRTPYLGVMRSLSDEVYLVEPGSPGAVAGLQVGDRLTHVDGVPINEAVPLFGSKGIGDSLSFSLLRDGAPPDAKRPANGRAEPTAQTIGVTLVAPPLRVHLRRLSYLAIALAFWLAGTFVLARKPAESGPRLFFALCQTGAAALIGISLVETGEEWPGRLISVCILLSSALLIHFHMVFPRPKLVTSAGLSAGLSVVEGGIPARRLLLSVAYGVSIGLALFHTTEGIHRLSRYTWLSILQDFGRLYFVAAVLMGLLMLFHTYRATDYGPVRRRIRLVLFGTAVALLPLALLNFAPDSLQGYPLISDEVALLSLAAIPLAYGYGIIRYNLMDIDLVINRTLVYFTLSLLLMLGYMLIVTGAGFIPERSEGSANVTGDVTAGGRLMGAAASLVVAAGFAPLRIRVQSSVDRLFDRAAYDYQAVVGNVSRRLSRTLHEDRLENLLVEQLRQAMGLKGVALLLPGSGGDLVVRHVWGFDGAVRRASLRPDGPLARHLVALGRPVEADRLRREAENLALDGEADLLGEAGIRLWVPLILGDELQGVLLLGAKYTDEFFSREDRQILATLAHQAALAARNQQLVGELQQRMVEIAADKEMLREMHRGVVQSREEERKRLSWELHDQTVQSLLGLKIQVEGCTGRIEDSVVKGQLAKIAERVQGIVDDMRRICAALRPPLLDERGLAAAIRSYIKNPIEGQSSVPVRTVFPPDDQVPQLSGEMSICLYRVVQEALQNVHKHARAREAWVELVIEDDRLELVVGDDGQGFTVPRGLRGLTEGHHFGLVSIRERVEAIGGQLAIHSQPGQGTTIHATVPLTDHASRITHPCPERSRRDASRITDHGSHLT